MSAEWRVKFHKLRRYIGKRVAAGPEIEDMRAIEIEITKTSRRILIYRGEN